MATDPTKTSAGARANVVSMDKATREIERLKKQKADWDPHLPRGPNKVPPGHWQPDIYGMPSDPGCESPVEPIGFEGEWFYFIDSRGQFRAIKAEKLNQVGIQDLFSATPNYPKFICPRWSKPVMSKDGKTVVKESEIVSFEADDIKEMMFLACSRKGFFSPADKMRGRGAWTFRSGNLVYHTGDALWVCEKGKFRQLPTGVHEAKLYPRLSSMPEPWTEAITAEDNPAGKLLQTFRKWHWTRPDVDPVLLLGWIGCAFLGGALDWRSAVLLLGDWGTGKSTLQDVVLKLFGEALMRSADTTAAGIYQSMAHDSRPIALDEMEPDADSRKLANVVHLMRTSASGDIGQRGGPTKGEASQFQMRSAFLFSAINNPLHGAQDMSRCAVLRLLPIDKNQAPPPPIDAERTGPMILSLLMQGWGNNGSGFRATLDRMMKALSEGGHVPRGQKQYGTLLACAWLMLGPELCRQLGVPLGPDEDLHWSELLKAEDMPEVEDAQQNYRQCVDQILTRVVPHWRNSQRNTIGQTIEELRTVDRVTGLAIEPAVSRETAKRDLNMAGFGLFNSHELVAGIMRSEKIPLEEALVRFGLPKAGWILAVPNKSVKVAEHLAGSDWQHGGWRDALRQCPVPGIMITDAALNKQTIDGTQTRCTLIVLERYHGAPER